jgi:hypothetical protein
MVLDSRVSATYLLKLVSSVFTNSWVYSCTVSTQLLDGTVLVILQQGDLYLVRMEITSQSEKLTGRAAFDFYCLF